MILSVYYAGQTLRDLKRYDEAIPYLERAVRLARETAPFVRRIEHGIGVQSEQLLRTDHAVRQGCSIFGVDDGGNKTVEDQTELALGDAFQSWALPKRTGTAGRGNDNV